MASLFDHVPPPATPEGGAEPWDVLGIRVPAIVVSPFTPKTVVSEPFEHTSILRTIAERWDLDLPAEAGPRLPKVKSLWSTCSTGRARGRSGSSVVVPPVAADWRAQIAEGDGPVRSDMAESLIKAAQVSSLAELDAMMGDTG